MSDLPGSWERPEDLRRMLKERTERLTLAIKALERIREVKAYPHNPYYVHALNVSIALDSSRQIAREALAEISGAKNET